MTTQEFNLDTLLDGKLDDLADMPEFKPFPAGLHRVYGKMEQKVVNNHPCIELKLKAIETVELPANSEDTPLVPGAETSVLFMLDNEIGQGSFKKVMKNIAEVFGVEKTNRELLAEMSGWVECVVVTKQRRNKEKTQTYTDIVDLQVEQ